MTDDDFKQTVLDYFGIATQRHRDIMATLADVKAGIDSIKTELSNMETATTEALAALKDTGQAGHSAIMDEIVAEQATVLSMVKDTSGKITAAIAANPVPGSHTASAPLTP